MKSMFQKIWMFGFAFFLASIGVVTNAATGTIDYVNWTAEIGDGQYWAFLELVNSPIGYLLMFVLGLGLLKWMGFEIKSMTPSKK